ncbi:MAG: hypothetical protein IJS01_09060 [Lentisphaeria bacterium]|nr:hypothetical protein [Lentisphaeria bacterium]
MRENAPLISEIGGADHRAACIGFAAAPEALELLRDPSGEKISPVQYALKHLDR